MRWRLLAAFLGVMVVVLAAQDLPLVSHLRRVEVDRQLAELERDAFLLASQAASALTPPDGADRRTTVSVADTDAGVALTDSVTDYAERNDRQVVVTDDDGVVVTNAGDASATVGDDVSASPEVATALSGEPATGRADGSVSISVPVFAEADTVGAVMISAEDDEIDSRASSSLICFSR